MYSSDYADVLSYIYEEQQRIDPPDEIPLKDIANACSLTPQRVGYILRDLNIPTKRRNYGKIVDMEDQNILKQLEYLYHKFAIGRFSIEGDDSVG